MQRDVLDAETSEGGGQTLLLELHAEACVRRLNRGKASAEQREKTYADEEQAWRLVELAAL